MVYRNSRCSNDIVLLQESCLHRFTLYRLCLMSENRYRISLNKRLPRINADLVYTPGVNWAAKLINAGSQIDAGGVARTDVRTRARDDLWPRVYYHSTTTVQTTHARLFVAVAALARNAARCLPSITSLK